MKCKTCILNYCYNFSLIDEATKYEVSIFDNGNKFVSKTTPGANVTIINLDAGKTYKVKIVTCRSVNVDGETVEFLGDAFEKDLLSGKYTFLNRRGIKCLSTK